MYVSVCKPSLVGGQKDRGKLFVGFKEYQWDRFTEPFLHLDHALILEDHEATFLIKALKTELEKKHAKDQQTTSEAPDSAAATSAGE